MPIDTILMVSWCVDFGFHWTLKTSYHGQLNTFKILTVAYEYKFYVQNLKVILTIS